MIYLNKSDFLIVLDLNRISDLGHARRISSAGDRHAFGSTRLCANHDLSALEGIQSHGHVGFAWIDPSFLFTAGTAECMMSNSWISSQSKATSMSMPIT